MNSEIVKAGAPHLSIHNSHEKTNIMNQKFGWSRFCKVVRKDFYNIWQNAGHTLLIITLLPLAAWLLWAVLNGIEFISPIIPEVRWCFICGVVMLAAIMTPSRMYRTCNVPREGIYFAMLPASKLEKFLSMILYAFIVCPLLCLFGSVVLDCFLTMLPFGPYEQWLWQGGTLSAALNEIRIDTEEMAVWLTITSGIGIVAMVLSCLGNVATFFFTNTIFKKHKVLMTFLWLWLISFAFQIILTPIFGGMMINGNIFSWFENLEAVDPKRFIRVCLWIGLVYNALYLGVLVWWSGYRLKRMKY